MSNYWNRNYSNELSIKGSVTEQVSEINEMFDIITSVIKQKPLRSSHKQSEPQIPKVIEYLFCLKIKGAKAVR